MFSQVSLKCSTGKSTLIAVFVGIMVSLSSRSEAATMQQGLDIQARERVQQMGAGGALPNEAISPQVNALCKQQINKIPQAILVFNWQARHFMMWDEPVWLLNQINQFLAEK